MTDRSHEARHQPRPGAPRHWEESYYFDFVAAGGSLGGYVRLGLRPGEGRAWYWASLVGAPAPGPRLLLVRDHEVPLPGGRALEVRAPGLWSDLTCETPLEHWTIGLEAFGVSLDEPADAYRGELGERWSLGFDLEWEAAEAPRPVARGEGYQQPCAVYGEVLEGSRRIEVEGRGWRSHAWGERRWWHGPSAWAGGHLDDGTPFASADGGRPLRDAHGLVREGHFDLDGATGLVVTPVLHAPLAIEGGDGVSHLDRALCRVAVADGRAGAAWAEWLAPPVIDRDR